MLRMYLFTYLQSINYHVQSNLSRLWSVSGSSFHYKWLLVALDLLNEGQFGTIWCAGLLFFIANCSCHILHFALIVGGDRAHQVMTGWSSFLNAIILWPATKSLNI